jgi:hypothetical protein
MAMDLSHVQHQQVNTNEVKHRKDNNLCMYCGADDHWIDRCPKKTSTKQKSYSKVADHSISTILANPELYADADEISFYLE